MKTFFFLMLLPLLANAQEWIVNKDHSEIFFSVKYLEFSEVTGRFADFKGAAMTDSDGKIKQIDLQIPVSSLTTENKLRDSHLKAPDFLNTRVFPEITFTSSKVTTADGKNYSALGSLYMHGKARNIEVKFELSPSLKDSWGYENKFAKFEFVINRKDFDLVWNKTIAGDKYLVGDQISVRGALQLQPLNSLTPGSKHFIPVTSFTRGKEKLKRGEITREEFEKTYLPPETVQPESASPKVASDVLPERVSTLPEGYSQPPSVKTWSWWIAFSVLGLLGFFAAIIVGFFAKNELLHFFPKKYSEGGVLGNFGDLLVVGVTIVYSMAFWYIGWGS